MNKLHIISFDVPFPADYGGVIDIFYRIKALHKRGVKIVLHTYQYGRKKADILEDFCEEVIYYKRRAFKNPINGKKPYIVSTRNNAELLNNLKKDKAPILFEGLHCTYYLGHKDLKKRIKYVRMHNIEHHYYKQLEKVESNYFKKYFFRIESERLKKYLPILKHADYVLTISDNDTQYIQKKIGNALYFPAFHPNEKISSKTGKGEFLLYHGNLAVGENNFAALWLIKNVFSKINHKCIIAGNSPSVELVKSVSNYPNIELNRDIDTDSMLNLIEKAQINILATFQATGIKLKLLNALFRGRFCISNTEMIENTGVEDLCINSETPKKMIEAIDTYMKKEFTIQEIHERENILLNKFSNESNLDILIKLLNPKAKLNPA